MSAIVPHVHSHGGVAMFAPSVAKPRARAVADSTNSRARKRPTSRPFGGGAVEQARMLQGTIGNQAALRYLTQRLPVPSENASGSFAKAAVSQPGEPLEREADHIAERAMHAPQGAGPSPHAKPDAPVALGDDLAPASGRPLERGVRADMERRLGADFGAVRVHTGVHAARSAAVYDALAYTSGRNIVFGEGQYAPESAAGRRLLAHELAHVMQQSTVRAGGTTSSARIFRAPAPRGTQDLHESVVEEYRVAHGLPPHGIDPTTGMQVGPTDQEIRFGGLLEAWIDEKSGTVPAPEKPPKLAGAGSEDVKPGSRKDNKGDENDYHFSRRHREFAVNIFPQAVENIRKVSSPYSEAIYKLYASVLAWMKLLAGATPKRGAAELQAVGYPGALKFGSTTVPAGDFTLVLDQKFSSTVAEERNSTSGIEIWINESSDDILLQNFPAIESAMVHEAMHAFSKIVQQQNATGIAPGLIGLPTRTPVDLNLDLSSYGTLQGDLANAALPYVSQIQKLPSQGLTGLSAQFYSEMTARILIGEMMPRVEEAIYQKQRAGQGFGPADLAALPDFYTFDAYWEPAPTVNNELVDFLLKNREQIRKDVGPVIREVGARYLSLRPRTTL
jgi:hypothetical protein